jgi:hypothetical protein
MSHAEQLASAFNAGGQQLPIELVENSVAQIDSAVAAYQQAGGAMGDELTGIALSIKTELAGISSRLQELRQRSEQAAQAVMQRGF